MVDDTADIIAASDGRKKITVYCMDIGDLEGGGWHF